MPKKTRTSISKTTTASFVGNDRKERVEHNETVSIGDHRTEDVGQNETISIGANRSVTITSASETGQVFEYGTPMPRINGGNVVWRWLGMVQV